VLDTTVGGRGVLEVRPVGLNMAMYGPTRMMVRMGVGAKIWGVGCGVEQGEGEHRNEGGAGAELVA